MREKILFCTGEGIGNVVQTLPAVCTLNQFYDVDYWHAFGSFNVPNGFLSDVRWWYSGSEIQNINPSNYIGFVSTYWTRNHVRHLEQLGMKNLANIHPLTMERSEVDTYLDIVRDLGIDEAFFLIDGSCNFTKGLDGFDVVLMNGYNRHGSAKWEIKGYPYFSLLTGLLINEGYSVCSVGAPNEYIVGTENKTGLSLEDTAGIIHNSELLISTDTGMYHVANAVDTTNIVLFTATSTDKNYDERFHRYSTIVGRDDLKCRPCQKNRLWKKECTDWECQNIEPSVLFEIAEEKLNK